MLSLNGPDVPSRPTSPWTSDFYDSEFEVDRDPNRSRRSGYSSNANSLQRDKNKAAKTGSDAKPDDKAGAVTNYLYYRSQNVLGHGPPYAWPNSEQSTLNRGDKTTAADSRRAAVPRDLFELARRRRQGEIDPHGLGLGTAVADRDADWGSRSRSLPRTKTVVDRDRAETGNTVATRPSDFKSLRAKSSSPFTLTSLQSSSTYAQNQQPQRSSSPTPKFQR
jgi:hypothetical protein